ncbi:hypothetical protein V9T40_007350 [Parthenolecanium corni]|uniref:AP180 N-terminal homology (ANTH) domain-containing protein n=1 Tax=Parthenolecanium corni TaxID=536013 RepID=A0AAN9YBQ2_9HEMI
MLQLRLADFLISYNSIHSFCVRVTEKYFDMNKKQCREALDLYKKFLIRMDRVGEFLKVAENIGIDKGEIPDLTKAPSSLLDALEQHLAALEGKKSIVNTPTQAATQQRSEVRTGVSALSTTSSSFGTAAQQSDIVDETVTKQALAEEEAILNQYKAKVQSPVSNTGSSAAPTNPFLTSPSQPIVDLFSAPTSASTLKNANQTSKASDDLLQLGNPFADMFSQPAVSTAAPATAAASFANCAPPSNNIWMTNGFSNNNTSSLTNAFVDDRSFTSVFGDSNSANCATSTTAASNGSLSSTAPLSFASADPNGMDLIGGGGAATADDSVEETRRGSSGGAPPPRPPPPGGAPKSALDDLNDSIRVAMGSPSRPPPPSSASSQIPSSIVGVAPGAAAQPMMQSFPPQIPPQMYGSPVKFAPGTTGSVTSNAASSAAVTNKVLTGDLESSIASLAENLTINKSSAPAKPIQWNSPAKGGNSQTTWTPQPMAATTGVNYKPMGMQSIPAARMAVPPFNMPMMSQPQQTIVPQQSQPQATTLDPFGAL